MAAGSLRSFMYSEEIQEGPSCESHLIKLTGIHIMGKCRTVTCKRASIELLLVRGCCACASIYSHKFTSMTEFYLLLVVFNFIQDLQNLDIRNYAMKMDDQNLL